MCRHAVVTFLNSPRDLRGVDSAFRVFVEVVHTIPFCATFGVSCAGHLECYPEEDSFYPSPYAHLNIMMAAELAHVARFRDLIARIVSGVPDARFTQIPHLFGPPMECPAQVWEIRAGDNDCLATLGNEYFGGKLEISKNQEVFAAALKRYLEIQQLWVALTKEAKKFAEMNGSGKFDLDCRVRELVRVWHEFSRASKTGGRD